MFRSSEFGPNPRNCAGQDLRSCLGQFHCLERILVLASTRSREYYSMNPNSSQIIISAAPHSDFLEFVFIEVVQIFLAFALWAHSNAGPSLCGQGHINNLLRRLSSCRARIRKQNRCLLWSARFYLLTHHAVGFANISATPRYSFYFWKVRTM